MINFSSQQRKYIPYLSILTACALLLVMLWLAWQEDSHQKYADWAIKTKGFFAFVADDPKQSMRFFTSLFLHGSWSHWLINCSVFVLLAFSIERVLGWQRFMLLYFGAGLIGNLAACLTLSGSSHVLLGASGAVSGLIGAWLVLFPGRNIRFIVPIGLYLQKTSLPLAVVIFLWLSIQIALQFMATNLYNVAWISHIAGFTSGFLLARFVK